MNFSDPFGLCPDPKRPECSAEVGTASIMINVTAALGPFGFNVQLGGAANRDGAVMAFGRAGWSGGIGVAAGVQGSVQKGSLDDIVKSVNDSGGFTFEGVGSKLSLGVQTTEGVPSGISLGGRARFGIFMSHTMGGVASPPVNVTNAGKGTAGVVNGIVESLICRTGPCFSVSGR